MGRCKVCNTKTKSECHNCGPDYPCCEDCIESDVFQSHIEAHKNQALNTIDADKRPSESFDLDNPAKRQVKHSEEELTEDQEVQDLRDMETQNFANSSDEESQESENSDYRLGALELEPADLELLHFQREINDQPIISTVDEWFSHDEKIEYVKDLLERSLKKLSPQWWFQLWVNNPIAVFCHLVQAITHRYGLTVAGKNWEKIKFIQTRDWKHTAGQAALTLRPKKATYAALNRYTFVLDLSGPDRNSVKESHLHQKQNHRAWAAVSYAYENPIRNLFMENRELFYTFFSTAAVCLIEQMPNRVLKTLNYWPEILGQAKNFNHMVSEFIQFCAIGGQFSADQQFPVEKFTVNLENEWIAKRNPNSGYGVTKVHNDVFVYEQTQKQSK